MTFKYFDEAEEVKTMLEEIMVEKKIPGIFFIFTTEPKLRNEFPLVQITSEGSSPENVIGDITEQGTGNYQFPMIRIEVVTRKGFILRYRDDIYSVWDSTTTYAKDIIIIYGFKLYKSKQNANLNKNPETQPDWWEDVTSEHQTNYENDKLVNFVANTISTMMFENRTYVLSSDKDFILTNDLVGNTPQEAFVRSSPYYTRILMYRVEVKRSISSE